MVNFAYYIARLSAFAIALLLLSSFYAVAGCDGFAYRGDPSDFGDSSSMDFLDLILGIVIIVVGVTVYVMVQDAWAKGAGYAEKRRQQSQVKEVAQVLSKQSERADDMNIRAKMSLAAQNLDPIACIAVLEYYSWRYRRWHYFVREASSKVRENNREYESLVGTKDAFMHWLAITSYSVDTQSDAVSNNMNLREVLNKIIDSIPGGRSGIFIPESVHVHLVTVALIRWFAESGKKLDWKSSSDLGIPLIANETYWNFRLHLENFRRSGVNGYYIAVIDKYIRPREYTIDNAQAAIDLKFAYNNSRALYPNSYTYLSLIGNMAYVLDIDLG